MRSSSQRATGAVGVLATAFLSLPIAAALFDSSDTDNWILPFHIVLASAAGGALAMCLPAMTQTTASTPRRILLGIVAGALAALVSALTFSFFLGGIGG